MARTASEATKESEQRRGVKSTSFKFNPDEMDLLDRLAADHGGKKGAIMAGLRKLDTQETSATDVIAWVVKMASVNDD